MYLRYQVKSFSKLVRYHRQLIYSLGFGSSSSFSYRVERNHIVLLLRICSACALFLLQFWSHVLAGLQSPTHKT